MLQKEVCQQVFTSDVFVEEDGGCGWRCKTEVMVDKVNFQQYFSHHWSHCKKLPHEI